MKNSKIWTILLCVVLLLQVVAEALATFVVLRLNMLPVKYAVALIGVLGLLIVLTGSIMFLPVKGRVALWRRITAMVLALLIACGCFLIAKVAADAYRTMSGVTGSDLTTNARDTYVVVLKENAAQSVADTKGYTFGVIENYDIEQTQRVIDAVSAENGEELKLINYAGVTAMADALYSNQTDALIISGVSISFLVEDETYADFLGRIRILYTLPYSDTQGTEDPAPTQPPENVVISPFVVYISGSDTRNDTLTVSLSDVNILAVVNPQTKQVFLLNTPRDYFVPNPAGNGALDKLTHCGRYGIDCSIQALEDLYDIKIDYYGRINFKGFEGLVDAIGGITFYAEKGFQARDTYIKAGENHLTGVQALDVARELYHVKGGDNGRGKNQMKMVTAVIEKVTSSTALISNYAEVLRSLEGMIATSFRAEEISALVKMQLSDMASWDIKSFAVTGSDGNEITYSYRGETLYVMWPNEEMVEYASTLVQKVLGGEILTEEDVT